MMTDKEVLLLRHKLDLLLYMRRLLIGSATDANRVERSMKRIAAFMGIPEEKLHIDIRWTMITVNISDERNSFSRFQKCEKHSIGMTAVSQVSKLSWRAIEQDYSLNKYEEKLEKIAHQPWSYAPYIVAIGTGFACGGLYKLFECDRMTLSFASTYASVGFRVRARCAEARLSVYMSIAAAAFVFICLAYASSSPGPFDTPYHPLLVCALFIVPGVSLVNFVDDMLDNHLPVSITRASNTVMMVATITFGIAFAMRALAMSDVETDHKFSGLNMVPYDPYHIYTLTAAIPAIGPPMISNTQRRLLWVIAVGGITAVCTRNFVNFELGYGSVIGPFMGNFVVSLLAVKAVHWCHVPNRVLTIPSVTPMISGIFIYRSLPIFVDLHGVVGEATDVLLNGINSVFVILCISFGVAVPSIFARRHIAKDRQRHLQEELEKYRERGKFTEW